MLLFDCNAVFGRLMNPPMAQAVTAAELRAEMDRCGTTRALVRHALMDDMGPALGNQRVIEEIDGVDGLEATWMILPPQTNELGTVEQFLADMKRDGVRALWAFPGPHRYVLNATTLGPLLEETVARDIPLFIRAGDPDWEGMDRLLADFPKLTLIAAGLGCWGQDRFFRPLVERYANFHVDISGIQLDRGLEKFCDKYGPDRLLFGTNYPFYCMGGPVLSLLHADIGDAAREAIASGNLLRLLEAGRL